MKTLILLSGCAVIAAVLVRIIFPETAPKKTDDLPRGESFVICPHCNKPHR